jgi:hypothetical protein
MGGRTIFLLANVALAFYNVGTIWAHEVDVFRSWRLLDVKTFRVVQAAHWKKLPYWIFAPVAASLVGAATLVWYHPADSPAWAVWGNLGCQALSHVLTAVTWGRWQAALTVDPLGPQSPFLGKILRTHWIRTALTNAHALILFVWAIRVMR